LSGKAGSNHRGDGLAHGNAWLTAALGSAMRLTGSRGLGGERCWSGWGERGSVALPLWQGVGVLREEADHRIFDGFELLLGADVKLCSRLGLGEAPLGNGRQFPPLLLPPHRPNAPVCALALAPLGWAIGAQDVGCSRTRPAEAKRVHGKCRTGHNQHPAGKVVPSG